MRHVTKKQNTAKVRWQAGRASLQTVCVRGTVWPHRGAMGEKFIGRDA